MVIISRTDFHSHLLPSGELVWLPMFFFGKNGGREEQVKKIISIMERRMLA